MKGNRFFLTLIFLISSPLVAAPQIELGTGIRWERSTGGTSVDHQGLLGMGLSYPLSRLGLSKVEVLGEFSMFSSQEQESAISISRDHYEFMTWGRFRFFQSNLSAIFLSAGIGFFWEQVQTQIVGKTFLLSSDPEFLLGFSAGYQYVIKERWTLNFRLRAIMNTNNSLSPVADTLVRIGYIF